MAEPTITRRIGLLATSYPAAVTPTRLYTCPQETAEFPGREAVMSSSKIRIANNSATPASFAIWIGNVDQVRGNNGTVATPYATPTTNLQAWQEVEKIAGDALSDGGWIDVQSSSGSVSFQLFGEETIVDP